MARAATRRAYLETSLPSEWNEYATGSRSSPFVSVGTSLGSLTGTKSPTLIGAIFDQKSKFESKSADPGSRFQTFLNLQRDPNFLVASKMKVPTGFNQVSSLMSSLE